MLVGEPPLGGATPQAVISRRFTEPVPHVARLRETVPAALDHVVAKAMAKLPADRFTTAAEFDRALAALEGAGPPLEARTARAPLRRLTPAGGGVVLALAIAITAILRGGVSGARAHEATRPKILVLPFPNQIGRAAGRGRV